MMQSQGDGEEGEGNDGIFNFDDRGADDVGAGEARGEELDIDEDGVEVPPPRPSRGSDDEAEAWGGLTLFAIGVLSIGKVA